jgi:hypothetical protein
MLARGVGCATIRPVSGVTAQSGSSQSSRVPISGWTGPLDVPHSILPWVLVAVAGQVAINLGVTWHFSLGIVAIPVLALPSLALVLVVLRAWAPPDTFLARVAIVATTAIVAVVLTFAILPTGWGTTVGFVLAAAYEESVFRFAAPVVVALVAHRIGLGARLSAAMGFVAAAAWFVFQPGHLGQIAQDLDPLTDAGIVALIGFAVFAAGFTWFVWYARMVLPAIMLHAAYNLLLLAEKLGAMVTPVRALAFAVLVAAVAVVGLHYHSPRLRAHRERLARARAATEPSALVSS